ncbi:hypothetical protein K488DRAFT_75409, partial [Vararia minispora EC-137]
VTNLSDSVKVACDFICPLHVDSTEQTASELRQHRLNIRAARLEKKGPGRTLRDEEPAGGHDILGLHSLLWWTFMHISHVTESLSSDPLSEPYTSPFSALPQFIASRRSKDTGNCEASRLLDSPVASVPSEQVQLPMQSHSPIQTDLVTVADELAPPFSSPVIGRHPELLMCRQADDTPFRPGKHHRKNRSKARCLKRKAFENLGPDQQKYFPFPCPIRGCNPSRPFKKTGLLCHLSVARPVLPLACLLKYRQ